MQTIKQEEQEITSTKEIKHKNGKVEWESPSNIALIKYWGKKSNQIPQNPSISFSLNNSITHTTLEFKHIGKSKFFLQYYYDNQLNTSFATRIENFLTDSVIKYLPFVSDYQLIVRSRNTFPHSSGIASSASFYSSLALCLCSMEQILLNGKTEQTKPFFEKASFLARLGSGSASRSVYGGFNLWGKTESIKDSSDEKAIPINNIISNKFKKIRDAICIVTSGEKKVSSSQGHKLLDTNPYASARYKQAKENTEKMLGILEHGNYTDFISLVESEALTLHALMMSSNPSYVLMKPNTLNIIEKVQLFRESASVPIAFTLDAGANVHILYSENSEKVVKDFLMNDIVQHCEKGQIIYDGIGEGPRLKLCEIYD